MPMQILTVPRARRPVDAAVAALGAFGADLRYEDLPSEVRTHVAHVVVDMFGVVVRGAQDPFLHALRRLILNEAPQGTATVLGTRHRTDPARAAFFNAAACTALQLDEGHRRAIGHPAMHVIPAALAIGEQMGASGATFLSAVVAGYEVAVRVALALGRLRPNLHPHGHWPVIGAAVAGAKVLGADQAQLASAIEAAATLTLHPMAQTTTDGTSVHHYFAGLGAQTAVTISYGIKAGMTASEGTLSEYFAPLSSGQFDRRELVRGIEPGAREFEILRNFYKFQPVCANTITTIEAVERLRRRLPERAIPAKVRVRTYAAAAELTNAEPTSPLAAKFSIPYVVAARLLDDGGADSFLPDLDLKDRRLRDLMSRVEVTSDPDLEREYPSRRPSVVEFVLEDGTIVRERQDMPHGDAENPATSEEVLGKFRRLAGGILPEDRMTQLVDSIFGLAESADIRALALLASTDAE